MSYGYIKSLDSASHGRYIQKLQSVGLDECPYDFPADKWINDPTHWPEVQYPDIYSYLVETPGNYPYYLFTYFFGVFGIYLLFIW